MVYNMRMVLVFHIVVAVASLACAAAGFFAPSVKKMRASYALTLLTLGSGVYLVVSTHARLVSSCMAGIVYLGVVFCAMAGTRRKLAPVKITTRKD